MIDSEGYLSGQLCEPNIPIEEEVDPLRRAICLAPFLLAACEIGRKVEPFVEPQLERLEQIDYLIKLSEAVYAEYGLRQDVPRRQVGLASPEQLALSPLSLVSGDALYITRPRPLATNTLAELADWTLATNVDRYESVTEGNRLYAFMSSSFWKNNQLQTSCTMVAAHGSSPMGAMLRTINKNEQLLLYSYDTRLRGNRDLLDQRDYYNRRPAELVRYSPRSLQRVNVDLVGTYPIVREGGSISLEEYYRKTAEQTASVLKTLADQGKTDLFFHYQCAGRPIKFYFVDSRGRQIKVYTGGTQMHIVAGHHTQ